MPVPPTPHTPAPLIACPTCDALYRTGDLPKGSRAACPRCHTVLVAPRRKAGAAILGLAVTSIILVAGALWFPFLRIETRGLARSASLWDVATSFDSGLLIAVTVAVAAATVVLPVARALLLLYVIGPLVADRPARPHARNAFALSEAMKPWSMAEIFAIGCAVSLVKIADLARVTIGPGFWMFAALVIVTVAQDRLVCRWSVWRAIDRSDPPRIAPVAA